MARIEAETGQQQPRFSFREQARRAVDNKILAHPFYTGVNAAIWGLSTPIDRKEAEEMFEGTTVVLRDPETVKKGTGKGESSAWRKLQNTWARNYEATGAYFGTGAEYPEIAEKFFNGESRQRVHQTVQKTWKDLLQYTGAITPGKTFATQTKPREIWLRREELIDGGSRLSRMLQAVENGKTGAELNQDEEFGSASYISIMRAFIKDLDLSFQIPYEDLMYDPTYLSSLKKLDNPNLFRGIDQEQSKKVEQEKERTMKQINSGARAIHGKEKLHVSAVTSVAENFLYVSRRDIQRIVAVLRREDVFVHEIPSILRGKTVAHYYLIAKGDIEYASGVLNLPEFDDLREPSVVAYGKKTDEPLPNTNDLLNGEKDGRYKWGRFVFPSKVRKMHEGETLPVEEIIGDTCPGTLYRERNGRVFIKTEERDALRTYFKERYGDLFGK